MTSTPNRPASRTRISLTITAVVLAVLIILFFIFAGLYTDVLWFAQVGYLGVLTTQWVAQVVLFLIGFFGMGIPVWLSIEIAFRWRPVYAKLNSQLDRYQQVVEPLRRLAMYGIPGILGIFGGVSAATRWPTVLQFLNRTSFGKVDPQFHLDISFYIYELPFWRGVVAFASAVVIIAGLAALATSYLYGALRLNGRELRISRVARVQLAVTAALYIALQSVSIWLDQYATLTSPSAGFLSTGAGFTEVNATIPSREILSGIAAIIAILFIVTAVIGRWRLPIIGTALLLVSGLIIGAIYPAIVQRFQAEPSAKTLEAPYITRNITATREAYGVANVKTQAYQATTNAQAGALRKDAETTANIRIIDPALVSRSFAQLQRVKQYYTFADHLDVDRYTINGKKQDTVIATRELDQSGLGDSRSWYNDTIVYTHGYGLAAAYGNQRTADGQPVFLESQIPVTGALGNYEPRIYFGENSPEYSIVGAKKGSSPLELDYPSGSDSAADKKNTFEGNGGPKLGNLFTRLLYAIKFQSEDIVLSNAVNADSQILYDRKPSDRVAKVAPYLTLDSDSYPAVVNGRIVWIVDGYTTSDNYPYSKVEQLSSVIADNDTKAPEFPLDDFNYIRNSVKATVDAYSGKVTLYAWDDKDPMLKTWEKIFPATVKPESSMSTQLLAHVRYPEDLFKAQRAILGSYHVTDAASFYSSNDQWVTPNEPTASGANAPLQPPYYLTMQVPGDTSPAFTLYSSFVPKSQGNNTNILTGYLAVDSDVGPNYGKLTLLTLPKQKQIPGPGQVENSFHTDTTVANALALLQRGDTKVELGNLLTLPVGGGLLYVQPVYVTSQGETSYPLLRKVLVSFGNTQVAFEDTLDSALDKLFGGDSGATAGDNGTDTSSTPSPGSSPIPTGSAGTNAEVNRWLQQANKDLQARTAAYAANDLVAAAEADKALQHDIQQALLAGG
ncbi:MAG: uncharacterized protein QOF79_325 [Actinomycetota bacterium]|nr:uncharacterized protein [Actinomycetota bacterium]